MELIQVDWLEFLIKTLGAFLLALPIGWEREQHTRIMGLRTFPLVAVASSAYVLIALAVLPESPQAQARIVQGLITGIGFIGGGAILKESDGLVRGTATAASIWTTGAVGAAVGYGRFDIAIIISLINFLTLRVMTPLQNNMNNNNNGSE